LQVVVGNWQRVQTAVGDTHQEHIVADVWAALGNMRWTQTAAVDA